METNMPITAVRPALIPNRLRIRNSTSSIVSGTENSDTEILAGSANFSILDTALIEKSVNKIIEAALACFLRLGKRERIPFPIITPCNKPIPTTTANAMAKFCSANSNTFKDYSSYIGNKKCT